MDALREFGHLTRYVVASDEGGLRYEAPSAEVLRDLCEIGGADLATARVFEGHLNALQLIALYGTNDQQRRVREAVSDGALLGVWGADGTPPLTCSGHGTLAGVKRYASGVGVVSLAIVAFTDGEGALHLLLMPVDDQERVSLMDWDHRGMRRSRSGQYDFTGLSVGREHRLGAPDDYRREPYFVGGIWRCCAAQLGAIEALVTALVDDLTASGRDAHPLQMARIGEAILTARTCRLWVEDAACRVEASAAAGAPPAEIEQAVSLAAYARLATEKAAMSVIELCERALGLSMFAGAHPAEALSRDLAVYIRQANPDAVLLQHGRVLMRDFAR
ncbi:acyl-CoA/acyl-ACP dehydrogenase [Aureimonas mangrovi]|uniref:acyl-CoA/acyl-ACP dehydrogenase n=1 Tax=Aureimonas mangrovi TaxID=2758041 RepID=UPI00163D5206|nr:acyl-CoA/acyl-ACP dehydrogenase [Aureimonas mangrovi]